jgi:hypothetical protein
MDREIWNKGKTKETDKRILAYSDSLKNKPPRSVFKNGHKYHSRSVIMEICQLCMTRQFRMKKHLEEVHHYKLKDYKKRFRL